MILDVLFDQLKFSLKQHHSKGYLALYLCQHAFRMLFFILYYNPKSYFRSTWNTIESFIYIYIMIFVKIVLRVVGLILSETAD